MALLALLCDGSGAPLHAVDLERAANGDHQVHHGAQVGRHGHSAGVAADFGLVALLHLLAEPVQALQVRAEQLREVADAAQELVQERQQRKDGMRRHAGEALLLLLALLRRGCVAVVVAVISSGRWRGLHSILVLFAARQEAHDGQVHVHTVHLDGCQRVEVQEHVQHPAPDVAGRCGVAASVGPQEAAFQSRRTQLRHHLVDKQVEQLHRRVACRGHGSGGRGTGRGTDLRREVRGGFQRAALVDDAGKAALHVVTQHLERRGALVAARLLRHGRRHGDLLHHHRPHDVQQALRTTQRRRRAQQVLGPRRKHGEQALARVQRPQSPLRGDSSSEERTLLLAAVVQWQRQVTRSAHQGVHHDGVAGAFQHAQGEPHRLADAQLRHVEAQAHTLVHSIHCIHSADLPNDQVHRRDPGPRGCTSGVRVAVNRALGRVAHELARALHNTERHAILHLLRNNRLVLRGPLGLVRLSHALPPLLVIAVAHGLVSLVASAARGGQLLLLLVVVTEEVYLELGVIRVAAAVVPKVFLVGRRSTVIAVFAQEFALELCQQSGTRAVAVAL